MNKIPVLTIFLLILYKIQIIITFQFLYIHENNKYDHVECTDVRSMSELITHVQANWTNIKVVNQPGTTLIMAEPASNPSIINIERLDLSKCGILSISRVAGFQEFTGLQQLNISNTRLAMLKPAWFSKINIINVLDVSHNRLPSLSRANLKFFKQLKKGYFSRNYIADITQNAFIDLMGLEELYLNGNQIKITTNIGPLPALKLLDLTDNSLTEIASNAYSRMISLETLILAQNSIRDIAENAFAGLNEIRLINISGNSISEIPANAFKGFNTRTLVTLDLNKNDITTIQVMSFSDLGSLQFLDLSQNSLRQINAEMFTGLRSLKTIHLYENDLYTIEPNTFNGFLHLEEIDLSGNSLQTIDGNIFGSRILTKLRKLIIMKNNIVSIQPSAFENIPNLDFLNVALNELITFDENLFLPLTKLKKLNIANNHITHLPGKMFDRLTHLTDFLFYNNKLTFFPGINNNLVYLSHVLLEGNPWQCPCLDEILEFLTIRNVQFRNPNSPYYHGKKPICVATPVKFCVRDLKLVKEHLIVEIFESH